MAPLSDDQPAIAATVPKLQRGGAPATLATVAVVLFLIGSAAVLGWIFASPDSSDSDRSAQRYVRTIVSCSVRRTKKAPTARRD